jgi:hypothetical protein
MPKPHLRLIVCSQAIVPETSRRGRRFQPAVIDGGRRTKSPAANPLEGLLDLVDLGIWVAQASYVAWLAASFSAIASRRRPEVERAF